MTIATQRFKSAERIADAILYEGYVLYPYRASATKNQFRWQFGVLAPERPAGDAEPSFARTETIIGQSTAAGSQSEGLRLHVRVRFLRPTPSAQGWLAGEPCSVDVDPVSLDALPMARTVPLTASGLQVFLMIEAERVGAFVKARLTLENRERWRHEFTESRDAMLAHALAAAHLLLAVEGGEFQSLVEPDDEAAATVAACDNRHTWPVLVGNKPDRTLAMSSPIVLYDYPAIAPESQGDLCDGAEIDEILSLRIMTLTDAEKAEARATDPRAREIVDRVDALTPESLSALHGTMRCADFFNPPGAPSPDQAFVDIGGTRVAKGSRVRLRPTRRSDSMDMFLAGQPATVAGVYRDVDERTHVAVTVDIDPAAALHESFGRFFYFDPAEVEPIDLEKETI
ncbi:MAG TPA: hypothetical protein VHZ73_09680 [Vicinamibacterales bacterium]|jgi:hypothetical protein|nr:hypothetical protein [Vicinamibacterales bacterium]